MTVGGEVLWVTYEEPQEPRTRPTREKRRVRDPMGVCSKDVGTKRDLGVQVSADGRFETTPTECPRT